MDSFVDIYVQHNPEIPDIVVLNSVFETLHRTLSAAKMTGVGISFPDAAADRNNLGSRLRLHGSNAALSDLMTRKWLVSMLDYVSVSSVTPVPIGTHQHRCVSRVQVKSSPERLRRRMMKRHNVDESTAVARIPDGGGKILSLPFLQITSTSTKQRFKLFIQQGPLMEEQVLGCFNSYGLSKQATIPWF